MRAFDIAASVPWAIYEPALQTILEIADRAEVSADALADWKAKMGDYAPEALASRRGDRLQEGSRVAIRNGVAIISAVGPIFRYANLFSDLSGATALSNLAKDFTLALEHGDARAILLDVNSPGGEVDGIAEFAAMIRAARGTKPMATYVGGLGASAAYWVASATGDVTIGKTALLGSIGVVSSMWDSRERDAKAGVRKIEIVSSQSPDKRADPMTDAGRAKLQALVDRLAAEFVADVATNRGVTTDKVVSDFGRGGVLVGADAVAAGMADRLGSFEEVLAQLAAAGGAGRSSYRAAAAAVPPSNQEKAMADQKPAGADAAANTTPTVAIIESDHPTIAAHFVKLGADAERARILGVQALVVAGHEALIAGLVADGKTTPEQASFAIVNAAKKQGGAALVALQTAFANNAVAATPGSSPNGAGAEAPKTPEQEWDACADGQGVKAEFAGLGNADGGKAAFLAGRKAEAEGRARVVRRTAAA